MKRFALILLLTIFLLSVLPLSGTMAGERTVIRHYSKDQNITGYSVIENGRESHFSKDWKREGYSIHREDRGRVDHFTRDWDRQGRSDIEKEGRERKANNPFE